MAKFEGKVFVLRRNRALYGIELLELKKKATESICVLCSELTTTTTPEGMNVVHPLWMNVVRPPEKFILQTLKTCSSYGKWRRHASKRAMPPPHEQFVVPELQ